MAAPYPAAFAMGNLRRPGARYLRLYSPTRHGEWSAGRFLTEAQRTASACRDPPPRCPVGAPRRWVRLARGACLTRAVVLYMMAAPVSSPGPWILPGTRRMMRRPMAGACPHRRLRTLVALGVASEWCVAYWGADSSPMEPAHPPGCGTSLTAYFAAMLVGRIAQQPAGRVLPPAVPSSP